LTEKINEQELTEIFRALGAKEPEDWARSQVNEGIPQLHRFLFLKQAWGYVVDTKDHSWVDNVLDNLRRQRERGQSVPEDPIERLLSKGVDRSDISALYRGAQVDMMSSMAYLLDDPVIPEEVGDLIGHVGWTLVATNEDFEPTDVVIDGIHESIEETDPCDSEETSFDQSSASEPEKGGKKPLWSFWRK